jgi:F0F1-type ATP synthase membrane subunit b/b'
MSQLNLKPDPIVLGVQAVIFLANMFVVKKLMLEPYLSLSSRREAQTGGSQETAHKLMLEAQALEGKITERMRAAHKEASQIRDAIKKEASDKRAALLAKAESESKAEQVKIESAITENLKEERSRKEDTIKLIGDQFFAQVTH